jgi:hypothetical protein
MDETDLENVFAATPPLRQVWRDSFKPEFGSWVDRASLPGE